MKSNTQTVDDYLKEVPKKRSEALKTIRELCVGILSGYSEDMSYGMPCYKRNDIVEVAFASQKQHICLYILIHEVMQDNASLLSGLNHGKGCIRYHNTDQIDFRLIEKILTETFKSESTAC